MISRLSVGQNRFSSFKYNPESAQSNIEESPAISIKQFMGTQDVLQLLTLSGTLLHDITDMLT